MKPNLNQTAITYGVITGLIYLALTFGAWAVGTTDTFVSITGITTFIPYVIVTLIIVGIKLRKSNDNLMSFQEALKFSFLAYVIYALIEAVGNYVLYAMIDPDLTAKVMEITMQKTMKMMEAFGASEQQMEEAVGKVQLDNGKKWKANAETITGINHMSSLVQNGIDRKIEAVKLYDSLKVEFKTIFDKCTMTGESHNQLHNYLIPIKGQLEKLKAGNNDAEILKEMQEYLLIFKNYFE